MDTVDFFAFPVEKADESTLFDLSGINLEKCLEQIVTNNSALHIKHAMLAVFDAASLSRNEEIETYRKAVAGGHLSFSVMPRQKDWRADQEKAAALDFKSIVLHPYLQNLEAGSLEWVVDCALEVERLGLFICVCCAYGGRNIYQNDPLRTVVAVADAVKCPIVITHGGGGKVKDALLIAGAFDNVLIDTSFSLPWWTGSSVENDFVFAMRKLGSERWMFGSDAPFVPVGQALDEHIAFFARHGFTDTEKQNIMRGTASRLLELE